MRGHGAIVADAADVIRVSGPPAATATWEHRRVNLARQVARVTLTGLLVVSLVAFVNTATLGYVAFSLDRDVRHATDAARAVRLAHLAMLDQETGLRAYLITGDETFLQPYREGRQAVEQNLAVVREESAGASSVLTLVDREQERIDAWDEQWATRALRDGDAIAAMPAGPGKEQFVADGKALFDAYRTSHDELETAADARRADLEQRQSDVFVIALIIELCLLIGTILVVRRQRRRLRDSIVEPVESLLGTIGLIRDGDLGARSHGKGPQEIRDIGTGLDEMADALVL